MVRKFLNAVLVLGLFTIAVTAALPVLAESQIVVTAAGSASIMPDIAHVYITISATAKTSEEATVIVAQKHEALAVELAKVYIQRAHIYTTSYSVQEIRDPKKHEKIRGHRADHQVQIKLSDVNEVDDIADLVARSDGGRVWRVEYFSSQATDVRRKALAIAVENARLDARVIAGSAAGELGELIELTTHFPDNPTYRSHTMDSAMAMRVGAFPRTSIIPQELKIDVTVRGKWLFDGAPSKEIDDR